MVIVIVVFQYRVPFNIIVRLIVGKDTGIRRGIVVVGGHIAIILYTDAVPVIDAVVCTGRIIVRSINHGFTLLVEVLCPYGVGSSDDCFHQLVAFAAEIPVSKCTEQVQIACLIV